MKQENIEGKDPITIEGKDPITIDCTSMIYNPKGGAELLVDSSRINFGYESMQGTLLGKTISKKDSDKDSFEDVTNYITEKMYSEEEILPLLEILQKCKEYFLLKTDKYSDERADAIIDVMENFKNK